MKKIIKFIIFSFLFRTGKPKNKGKARSSKTGKRKYLRQKIFNYQEYGIKIMNDYLNLEELENSVKPTLMAAFDVF